MSKPSAPTPPSPQSTAAASTGTNVGTAIANANLNNVNQVTPYGNLTYSQSGSYKWNDPYTGQSYDIPQYTATQSLSPGQQKLYDTNTQTQGNLSQIGLDASTRIGSLLGTNFQPDKAVEDKIDALGAARLDPQFARDQSSLETKLANQGIQPGSEAWKAQITQFQQGKNDAYNSLYLNGNQQAFTQALAERNQPINEITALLSGSQVQNPNYVNTPQNNIATTDTAGIINQNYQQQFQNYQTQNSNYQQMMGGLFGLGAAGVYKYSDRRLKHDIHRIGWADNGLPIYVYRMKSGGAPELGFMADEVEAMHPEAVTTINGYKAVDYSRALEAA